MRIALCAALALAASGSVLSASIETRAGAIVLPSQPPSSIAVTPCQGCKLMLVRTSDQSKYYINRQVVSLDELKRRLAGRPDAFVTLLYDGKTGELRELFASIY
jgi:hypothetical protein